MWDLTCLPAEQTPDLAGQPSPLHPDLAAAQLQTASCAGSLDQMSSDQSQYSEQALDGCAPHETGDYLASSPAKNHLCAEADLQTLQHCQTSSFCLIFCFASTLFSAAARVADLRLVSFVLGTQHPADLASLTW